MGGWAERARATGRAVRCGGCAAGTGEEVDVIADRIVHGALVALVLALALALSVAGKAAGAPEIVHNGAAPTGGVQTLALRELWRIDESSDVLLGDVQEVLADAQGTLYVLDRQLAQIQVFAPDGSHLRTLSREGEGPGESRQPGGLYFTPEGGLGIIQSFPGKVIRIDRSGNPLETMTVGKADPTGGGFYILHSVQSRGGVLAYSGGELSRTETGLTPIDCLALCNPDGSERVRLLEKTGADMMQTHRWVEKDQYFVHRGRWTLGPDGRLYAAPERDRYVVNVYAPDGTLQRVIEREFERRRRTAAEKEAVTGAHMRANGEDIRIEQVKDDYDPCIEELHVMDNGELWVLPGPSPTTPPAGVMQVYDVFDTAGRFVRQVAVACEGKAGEDRLFVPSDAAMVLVKGYQTSMRIMIGGGGDEAGGDLAEAPAAIEVIGYATR
jgi:hypothetical protein